ncbi:MAG: succinylglutamate desuccinylase/aspartoacylase family protein, partial [Planctomycetota bacterium]
MGEALRVREQVVEPGTRRHFELPVARLPTGTWLSLPLQVVCGARPGPRLWLSGVIHGDELNGVEIVRRVLSRVEPRRLSGSVLAAPIVNVFGFIGQSRYLPDRRDLNRSFPGSPQGSLASRLAHLFMSEVVAHSTHGIDLHSGSNHRTNLPQIRADLKDAETRELALAFGAPIAVDTRARGGSLRHAAARMGKPVLVYEAGEALRFEQAAIDVGVRGIIRVMSALGMLQSERPRKGAAALEIASTTWVRARRTGILRLEASLGRRVSKGEVLAGIGDAF